MEIQQKALYNLLRLNWLEDPEIMVEKWQVEDYRTLATDELFARLHQLEIYLDQKSLLGYGDSCDTPEDMTDCLVPVNAEEDSELQDRIYLLVFELWRRLIPHKPSLSIFCDELDHQISLYDQGALTSEEVIQDFLANLLDILDDNCDEGGSPSEGFQAMAAGCANDIEVFLYDYISELIDNESYDYANELVDGFSSYIINRHWFRFLRARLVSLAEPDKANGIVQEILSDYSETHSLELLLDVLGFMVQSGEQVVFVDLVKRTLPLIKMEEDFQDLLMLCTDFYQCLDLDTQDQAIQEILQRRSEYSKTGAFKIEDPDIPLLLKIIEQRCPSI